MRILTSTEWALVALSLLQISCGVILLIVNTILVIQQDILLWRYYGSDHIFGHPEHQFHNFTVVTCVLYVLGLTLFCCGVFGLIAVFEWRHRTTFILGYLASVLISLGCVTALCYMVAVVVGYQQIRLESFKEVYKESVSPLYFKDYKIAEYFDSVQKSSHCCGYQEPADWTRLQPPGDVPYSCCKFPGICQSFGRSFRDNQTRIFLKNGLLDAWDVGCYAAFEQREFDESHFSGVFYGCIIGLALLLQLTGLVLVIVYKLTNFNVIMRPVVATRL